VNRHYAAEKWTLFPVRTLGARLLRCLPHEYRQFLFWLACGEHSKAEGALEGSNSGVSFDHLLAVAYHNNVLPACLMSLGHHAEGLVSQDALVRAGRLHARQEQAVRVAAKLESALVEAGVDFSFQKGARLARYYPNESLRTYRDIDVHIRDSHGVTIALDQLAAASGTIYRAPCALDANSVTGFVFKCSVPTERAGDVIVEVHVGSMHLGSAGALLSRVPTSVERDSPAFDLLLQACEWRSRYGSYQLRDYVDFHFLISGASAVPEDVLAIARTARLATSLMAIAGQRDSMVGVQTSLNSLTRHEALSYTAQSFSRISGKIRLGIDAGQPFVKKPISRYADASRWIEGRIDASHTSRRSEWRTDSSGRITLCSPMGTMSLPDSSMAAMTCAT
jgi:putative nucleotidyltransferase-like protein